MSGTYSTKPFIRLDGEDENGVRAEVRVIKGFGKVTDIKPSSKGGASNVVFSVDNTKYDITGFTPVESNLIPIVNEAKETGAPIHFRIEVRRTRGVDRSLSMEEITANGAKDNLFRSLSAVRQEGDENWTISQQIVTKIEDDPKPGGSGLYSAYDMPNTASSPSSSGRNVSRSEAYEPAPYVSLLRDGRINPGSVAASVPLNFLSFLLEWDRNNPDAQIGENKHAMVAKLMLSAANELQLSIWDGEMKTPDLSSGSHTRARALVFEVTRSYLPFTEDVLSSKESMLEWRKAVVEKSLAMWRWSISEAENSMNIS